VGGRRRHPARERSHCECGACANIGALEIKAVVHYGAVAHKQVRGLHELAGEPVILLHRLLKNAVAAPRYVLLTAAFRDLLDDAAGALPAAQEHPDGFDPMPVYLRLPPQAPAAGLKDIATPFMQ
jgi:class 3 adenylate cyclase